MSDAERNVISTSSDNEKASQKAIRPKSLSLEILPKKRKVLDFKDMMLSDSEIEPSTSTKKSTQNTSKNKTIH